jgi:hypothetical protein
MKRLGLNQTATNDDTLEPVSKFTKLEALSLEYTSVSDAGFAKLAGLPLAELHLDHTNLTDASVKALGALDKLRYIDLYHTELTQDGYASLKKALPACTVNWSKDSTKRERRS